MKKYNYCFLMAAVYGAPHFNEYVALAVAVVFTITGFINASKDR